jgi:hypothetical protein
MNRKHFGVLILIASVAIVLAVVGGQRAGTDSIAGNTAGMPFLPNLVDDLDSVSQVLIDGAGRQRLVSLEREQNGWRVLELGGYAAERAQVNALLIALSEAQIVEEKTANPDFHSRLGVEDIDDAEAAGLELALVAADGTTHSAILGDGYTGGQRYARITDSALSVLIDRDPEVPRDPADWVVGEIVDIASERVQGVVVTHADGERLTLEKATRDDANFAVDGVPDGRELQYDSIANVTGTVLQGLQLDAVEPRAEGEVDALAVVEFTTFDGLVVTVTAEAAVEGENPWLTFAATFNADRANAFAAESEDEPSADAADQESTIDVSAEADAINARLSGWRYRIPTYQYSQLTRRMEDLLQAESTE